MFPKMNENVLSGQNITIYYNMFWECKINFQFFPDYIKKMYYLPKWTFYLTLKFVGNFKKRNFSRRVYIFEIASPKFCVTNFGDQNHFDNSRNNLDDRQNSSDIRKLYDQVSSLHLLRIYVILNVVI